MGQPPDNVGALIGKLTSDYDVAVHAPWASPLVGGGGGPTGGGEAQAVLLATQLAERGFRVGLIVAGAAGQLPTTFRGVNILPQAPRRRSRGPLARAALALAAMHAMTRVKADVLIQKNAGSTTGLAALAACLRGAGFIYMSASVIDFEFARYERSALNVRLYDWGIRRASEVVVQDSQQARLCRERFGREPTVIKSIAAPAEPRTEDPEAFLWVGRLQELKDPDAYLRLARAVPEAQFWMIAAPQETESAEMRRRVEVAGRELPNLHLLAPRPRAGLGDLMRRAVAIVSTSEREGMPNIFLEGWARGVPALTLSFDADGTIVRNGLGWSADGDASRFAEEARRVWEGRSDQSELAERCIAYVRAEHDADAVLDRWVETIERVRAPR